ncbi:MAG: prepilin-type N-terminal cleavage/methylation domain-containing protein [Candidatus Omnitrophica bacterium]|nr:prepilin-type N-terminal cleavage/methylation domain-containing protein [Candidatus Omnitrophota bacterium]
MNRKINAFTLIELLISMVILIVGLVGILLVIPLGQRAYNRSNLTTRATIFASEIMEELKAKEYDELTSQNEWTGTNDIFSWTAVVSDVDENDFQEATTIPEEKLVKMVLEISYKAQGKDRKETFTTFYSEL